MFLRDGRREDLPSLADVGCLSMWDDPIVQFLAPYRNEAPLSHRDELLHRIKRLFYDGDKILVAVTDETDQSWTGKAEIIGFAVWSSTDAIFERSERPNSILGNAFEQFALRMEGTYRWYFGIHKSYDKSKLAQFWTFLATNPMFEEIHDYCELEILAVDPRFQREGIGSKLLAWGLGQASTRHKPVIVAATANGEQLYRKHGFVECGKIIFPNNEFTWTALVWYPPFPETSDQP